MDEIYLFETEDDSQRDWQSEPTPLGSKVVVYILLVFADETASVAKTTLTVDEDNVTKGMVYEEASRLVRRAYESNGYDVTFEALTSKESYDRYVDNAHPEVKTMPIGNVGKTEGD